MSQNIENHIHMINLARTKHGLNRAYLMAKIMLETHFNANAMCSDSYKTAKARIDKAYRQQLIGKK